MGLLVAKSAWPTLVDIVPTTVTIVYGRCAAGDVTSLALADGVGLKVCKFVVPILPVDPVTFRVEANLPGPVSGLKFHVVSKATHFGQYTQSLNLFDWSKSLFDPMTNVTTPLTRSDTEVVCTALGDVSRYVRPNDFRVWALVRARALGFTPVANWQVEFDRAWFEIDAVP